MDFWSDWQRRRDAGRAQPRTQWVDWGEHPRILELVLQKVFGPPPRNLFECLAATFPQLKAGHALSLCCGDGGFERQLIASGVVERVTGIDLSPVRVAAADAMPGLELEVGDVNGGDFGVACYDAVIAKAALHHVEKLEAACAGIRRALKPGGVLIAIDFFGPTRFQWTDAQLAAVNRFLDDEVPDALRRKADGSRHFVARPTVEQMIAADPSEAVRSSEIMPVLRAHFTRVDARDIGGTLLQLIFDGAIVNNFDAANAEHTRIIDQAYALEQSLLAAGAIEADFKFVAAYND